MLWLTKTSGSNRAVKKWMTSVFFLQSLLGRMGMVFIFAFPHNNFAFLRNIFRAKLLRNAAGREAAETAGEAALYL